MTGEHGDGDDEAAALGWVDRMWTDQARSDLRDAADALIAAVRANTDALTTMAGRRRELAHVFAAHDALDAAARAFGDAQMELSGTSARFAVFAADEPDDEADDEDAHADDEIGDGFPLTVLQRRDFVVTDTARLIEQGRRAYAETWPDDTRDDAEFEVHNVGSAVSALVHDTWDRLLDTPGIEPIGEVTWIVPTEAPIDDDRYAVNPAARPNDAESFLAEWDRIWGPPG